MQERWFFRAADSEGGPLTFLEIQKLFQRGELGPDEHVRKEGHDWIPVRLVAGLFATSTSEAALTTTGQAPEAASPPKNPAVPAPKTTPPVPKASDPATRAAGRTADSGSLPRDISKPSSSRVPNSRQKPVVQRRWPRVLLSATPLLAGGLIASWWFLSRPERFPQAVRTPLAESSPERIAARAIAMRAPIPRVPSIPGLQTGTPVLLPGLEELNTAFSPALSADLRIVVFGAMGNPGTGYDLYLADRPSPSDAFSPPRLISSCATAECEAYPALSPDGLELIFARSDSDPVLMSTRRDSRGAEFPPPAEWTCPHLNDEGHRIGFPQFLDADRVAFSRSVPDPASREILMCERNETGSGFVPPEPLLMVDAFPLYFIAANRMRAYYGSDHGLGFTIRSQWEMPFGLPRPLADADVTGPIEGPIWVSPKEDIIFYCSAGVGQQPGSSRRLWMLRY